MFVCVCCRVPEDVEERCGGGAGREEDRGVPRQAGNHLHAGARSPQSGTGVYRFTSQSHCFTRRRSRFGYIWQRSQSHCFTRRRSCFGYIWQSDTGIYRFTSVSLLNYKTKLFWLYMAKIPVSLRH